MHAALKLFPLALPLVLLASSVSAQSITFGLRGTGSFPTGDFAADPTSTNSAVIQGAKQGFGYGAEVGLSMGPIGAYGSFDHIAFDCQTTACSSNGEYTLQGVTVGLKLMTPTVSLFRPFIKGGVTFNDLKGSYGGTSTSSGLTTDRAPGYEVGVGADLNVLGLVSIEPQVRYVGQNFKAKVPGVTNTSTVPSSGVNFFTFDLGLALHLPFGM
ncbi:MAG TPA: outer membrane beta-barrel protein [Gemmatimonadaceae bacterium]|jgi:opacity protein-like surface antigen|nr:outer membrane beta-barrel protein [Gemmatimonadaceae bacterium]